MAKPNISGTSERRLGVDHLKLIDPDPPRLSELVSELRAIEDRGIYSNYGPVNTEFEHALEQRIFDGGYCLTVSNATSGLLLALKQAAICRPGRRYVIMPSFTFAATAHVALWAGLTPVLCDIDPETWLACPNAEQEALAQYGEQVAAIMPCATFGYPMDAARYRKYEARYGCATVLDAAAALGTRRHGRQFTIGGSGVTVFSLHATKMFATFEGGLVHSEDPELIAQLRSMGNFGFTAGSRAAVMPGLNTKLPEVAALVGLAEIDRLESISLHRCGLAEEYRKLLPGFTFQPETGETQAHMFQSLLLPRALAPHRADIQTQLLAAGIGSGTYYSPHLGEQPYFMEECRFGPLPVSQDIADRVLTLPMHNRTTLADVRYVADTLLLICSSR